MLSWMNLTFPIFFEILVCVSTPAHAATRRGGASGPDEAAASGKISQGKNQTGIPAHSLQPYMSMRGSGSGWPVGGGHGGAGASGAATDDYGRSTGTGSGSSCQWVDCAWIPTELFYFF